MSMEGRVGERTVVYLDCVTVNILVVKLPSVTRPWESRVSGISGLFLLTVCKLTVI